LAQRWGAETAPVPATVDTQPKVSAIPDDECQNYPANGDGSQDNQLRLRTTNGQERLSQALKRRTRVVRIFPIAHPARGS
jgi:hypothetical protein